MILTHPLHIHRPREHHLITSCSSRTESWPTYHPLDISPLYQTADSRGNPSSWPSSSAMLWSYRWVPPASSASLCIAGTARMQSSNPAWLVELACILRNDPLQTWPWPSTSCATASTDGTVSSLGSYDTWQLQCQSIDVLACIVPFVSWPHIPPGHSKLFVADDRSSTESPWHYWFCRRGWTPIWNKWCNYSPDLIHVSSPRSKSKLY